MNQNTKQLRETYVARSRIGRLSSTARWYNVLAEIAHVDGKGATLCRDWEYAVDADDAIAQFREKTVGGGSGHTGWVARGTLVVFNSAGPPGTRGTPRNAELMANAKAGLARGVVKMIEWAA